MNRSASTHFICKYFIKHQNDACLSLFLFCFSLSILGKGLEHKCMSSYFSHIMGRKKPLSLWLKPKLIRAERFWQDLSELGPHLHAFYTFGSPLTSVELLQMCIIGSQISIKLSSSKQSQIATLWHGTLIVNLKIRKVNTFPLPLCFWRTRDLDRDCILLLYSVALHTFYQTKMIKINIFQQILTEVCGCYFYPTVRVTSHFWRLYFFVNFNATKWRLLNNASTIVLMKYF